jgi:trehalose 6-phosphate phosphatase
VTGRDVDTLLRLAPLAQVPGLVISGLHGAQTWRDGALQARDEPAGLAELRTSLPPLLASVDPDVWLEDKRLSLVVHTRASADPDGNLARLSRPVRQLAEAAGLEVTGGKAVLEIRIAGLSKADAVNALLRPNTTGALFAGDDLGDLPALAAVTDWGSATGRPVLTLAVGEVAEVRQAAAVSLRSPAALAELLSRLAHSHLG